MLAQLREQFTAFWNRQTPGQRVVLVVLVVAGATLAGLFLTWATTPSYSVAFTGLSEADAGQIVEQLNAMGVPYQLEAGGTILVPADQVYEVRLQMARQGLPEGGTVGFELFSGNAFGMTEFAQKVNYRRALEGELERTIASLNGVEAVRVHIVTPERSLLTRDQAPATASVTIKMGPGRALDGSQVRAITHLVASSVEGLTPENVVVVDVNGNLLAAGGASGETAAAVEADTRLAAEAAYAAEVQRKVEDLLNAVLGPNRSVVQASVRLDWTQREVTTQSFDPEATAVRSESNIQESYSASGTTLGGVPGAASNLPTPEAEATAQAGSASEYQRSEVVTNYEVTQTQSHEVTAPGQVERLSLSVLVDGVSDPAELETLRSAIAAAAGIDESRGDVLAVESLAFDRSFFEAQASELEKSERTALYWRIGQVALAVIALAALLFYVHRLLGGLKVASAQAWTPILRPAGEMALAAPAAAEGEAEALPEKGQAVAMLTPPGPGEGEDQLLARLAEQNPATVAEVLRLWMTEGPSHE